MHECCQLVHCTKMTSNPKKYDGSEIERHAEQGTFPSESIQIHDPYSNTTMHRKSDQFRCRILLRNEFPRILTDTAAYLGKPLILIGVSH